MQRAQGKKIGIFSWLRAPKSQLDGGAAAYGFERFQTLPIFDALNGNGYHVEGQLYLTSPGLFVPNPAGPAFDQLKMQMGELDLFEPPQEVSIA